MEDKNVFIIKNTISWFGQHTGYEQLIEHLDIHAKKISVINSSKKIHTRLIGKAFSLLNSWPARDQNDSYKEFLLYYNLMLNKDAVGHILYLENHLPFFGVTKKITARTTGTIHQPPIVWKKEKLQQLSKLEQAIILYEKDMDFFSTYIPNLTYIPHGADIDFFVPKKNTEEGPKHLLLAGHHLRNFEMFERVSLQLLKQHTDIVIDILIPERFRNHPSLQTFGKHARVHWHQNLNDEELRDLFQKAYLLFIPMNDSGANTAIVDCLACGLPIITTDVGGIRNYGGGSVYPVIENNKDDDMISLINQYLADPAERDRVSAACRTFACDELAWDIVAKKHQDLYKKM